MPRRLIARVYAGKRAFPIRWTAWQAVPFSFIKQCFLKYGQRYAVFSTVGACRSINSSVGRLFASSTEKQARYGD